MKQLIILRKDLHMSPGKAAVQACHASQAFVKNSIAKDYENGYGSFLRPFIDEDIIYNWYNTSYTKIIVEAKNLNNLLKVKEYASLHNLKEDKDYFIIKDHCLTELTPETIDEDGTPCTITAIGFIPLPIDIVNELSHHYQLYK